MEWISCQSAKREWAKKRRGKSIARVDEFRHNEVYDKIMEDHLAEMDGVATASTKTS